MLPSELSSLALAVLSWLAVDLGPVARPVTDDTERQAVARALFDEGLRHADAGRWTEAADRFERANALRPTPEITYNLSTSLVRQGRLVRASELLRHVASDTTASPTVRHAARTRLDQVVRRIAYLTVTVTALPDDALLLLNGRALERPFLGVAVPVDPTTHSFEVRRRSGATMSRKLSLSDGERLSVSADPLVAATTTATAAPPRRRWWAWGLLGAVAAAAVVVGATQLNPSDPEGTLGTWRVGGQ